VKGRTHGAQPHARDVLMIMRELVVWWFAALSGHHEIAPCLNGYKRTGFKTA